MAKVTRARIPKKLRKHASPALAADGLMKSPPWRKPMRKALVEC